MILIIFLPTNSTIAALVNLPAKISAVGVFFGGEQCAVCGLSLGFWACLLYPVGEIWSKGIQAAEIRAV
jgi:hypothetical protein